MLLSVFVLGIVAMTAQVAYLREVLATFTGGELTIGVALLFWLLWTSAGSGILGKIISRIENPEKCFHELFPWYGILGYAGTVIISNTAFFTNLSRGELVSYDIQFIAVTVAFLPFNILGGFLFVLGSKSITSNNSPSVGRAYTLEAAGSAIAGVAISFILVNIISNHSIALLCAVIGITSGAYWNIRHRYFKGLFRISFPIMLLAFVFFGNDYISGYHYKGQHILAEKDTKYGRLRITRKEEQITFYSDASALFSVPDIETAEYAVHIPMLAVIEPRSVLVLGGGPGGIIDEVLKYNTVERVTCVELDPALFELAKTFLDENWIDNPKIEIVFTDGRAYLESTADKFDVIVMNLPAPLSGITNRYYTSEFYSLASSHLSEFGILGFSLIGDENYISGDLAYFLSSVRTTVTTAFPAVLEIPGTRCRFLAGNSSGMFDSFGWEQLNAKREKLGIETKYVRDYFLKYTLSPMRMDHIRESLDVVKSPPVNSDTKPIGYFTRTILQGNLDSSWITNIIKRSVTPLKLWLFMLAVMFILAGIAIPSGKRHTERAVAASVISVGMTEISLEVLAIMAYQSIFGFLYGRIALLTGLYMTGLALGSWKGTLRIETRPVYVKNLMKIQTGIAVLPLLWIVILSVHSAIPGQIPFMEILFYVLIFLSGLAGGFQFPIADSLYGKSASNSRGLGAVYSIDIAGSSIGALMTASLMIPVLGMIPVLLFLSMLNLICAAALRYKR
ncbi:methyltransferase [Candidatus Latescibacterota bacterium]